MGKKKRRGHYCKICGRNRPNEKFSGKGHRQHICKDCKRKGKKSTQMSTSVYDREVNTFNNAIRNCLILYAPKSSFFLFEFRGARFITRDDFESEFFYYQASAVQKFVVEEPLPINQAFMEVLYKKYYESMESGHVIDYEDVLVDGVEDISKKRKQHLEVILSLKNLI